MSGSRLVDTVCWSQAIDTLIVAEDAITILLNLKLSFLFRKVKEICPTFKSKSFVKNHVFSP